MPEIIDYRSAPLGTFRGEEGLQAPFNARPSSAVVRCRNLSAVQKRRLVIEAVGIRHGGERSITEGPYKNTKNASVDALRFKVAQGENMDWVDDKIEPQDALLRFDGRRYLIPAFDEKTNEPAPWVTVPEGLWDLYMGNWERSHGTDRERIAELQQLNGRGTYKWVVGENNPYGYLEFDRQEIKVEEAAIDAARVRSGQLVEI